MYSHMHLINRVEARSIGLPVEDTSDTLENLLIAYDDELKNDLALMDKFDPAALLRATDDPQVSVTLERAYLETPSTCDGFVTRATVSQQPIVPGALPPGVPAPVLPTTATVEVTSEGWAQLA